MLKLAMHPQRRLSGGGANFFSNLRGAVERYEYAKIVGPYNVFQDMGLYSSVVRNLFRYSYVLRIDGIYFDIRNTFGDNDALNKKIFDSIRGASGVLFQSEFSRRLVEGHFGEIRAPHTVIINGAPIVAANRERKVFDKKVIVCSANWRPNKRLGAIVETVKRLRKNVECELVVIGDTGNNQVEENDFIHITGKLSHDQVAKYLKKADLFMHLSWLDPCPNSVVEATCHGVPVVCSNLGGTPEIVQAANGGRISQCDDEVGFDELVDLHHPPMPEIDVLVRDTEDALEHSAEIIAGIDYSAVDIRVTARKYVDFCQQVRDSL